MTETQVHGQGGDADTPFSKVLQGQDLDMYTGPTDVKTPAKHQCVGKRDIREGTTHTGFSGVSPRRKNQQRGSPENKKMQWKVWTTKN